MLALKLIRENTDEVREGLRKLNARRPSMRSSPTDDERRRLLAGSRGLKAERNTVSKQIGQMKDRGRGGQAQGARCAGRRAHQGAGRGAGRRWRQRLNDLMLQVPNLPHASLPEGPDETHNVVGAHMGRDARSRGPEGHRACWLGSRCRTGTSASAGHHRLRARRQAVGDALLRAQGPGRAAAAGADRLDARPAHDEARLHGDLPAVPGQAGVPATAPASCPSSPRTSTTMRKMTCG